MEAPALVSSGIKPPEMWSNSMIQHIMPFKYIHDERFEEQSAENVPDGSTPDSARKNSGNSASNASSQRFNHFPYGFPHHSIPNMNPVSSSSTPFDWSRTMHLSSLMEKEGNAQLTIFYQGNVNVFDDVSVEKANAIMMLASSGNPNSSTNLRGRVARRYLPHAQKASLVRFLERRRERMLSKSPYVSKAVDPEERLSSSNDVSTSETRRRIDE